MKFEECSRDENEEIEMWCSEALNSWGIGSSYCGTEADIHYRKFYYYFVKQMPSSAHSAYVTWLRGLNKCVLHLHLPLKRFPDASVSSLIWIGWCGRASHHQKLAPILMGGYLADGDFPLVVELILVKCRQRFSCLPWGKRPILA